MKKTTLTILVTAVVTWFVFSLVHAVRTGAERLWLISAIKAPGKMAIAEIQMDMREKRYGLANAKLQVLRDTWQEFEQGPDSFHGPGIGDIMVRFSRIENSETNQSALSPKQ